jgi:hypothetical protein
MKNYLIEIEKIINECFFIYPKQKICNAWNIESIEDFLQNKADILLKRILAQKIALKYIKSCIPKLYNKYPSFPPAMGELIQLMKPEHNYKMLFRECKEQNKKIQDYDYNQRNETVVEYNQSSIDELNKSSILFYNVALKMLSLKSISILSYDYESCKSEFQEVFDLVDYMDESELEPIPKFTLRLPHSHNSAESKAFIAKIQAMLSESITVTSR